MPQAAGCEQCSRLDEILTGLAAPEETIVATGMDNLFLLTSGQTPPNPSELLASPQMRALLEHSVRSFDHIIIDSPPALPVSDPIVLSMLVDGVMLVAAGNRTPKQQIKSAIGRLRHAHAKIFGLVLNRIKIQKIDYFFPYYKYYARTEEEDVRREARSTGTDSPDRIACA